MITLAQFNALERDMSYEEASKTLGEEGVLISSETARIEPGLQLLSLVTEIFEWHNPDGSVLRLLFKRDRLNEITQEGLE
jgi:hypothetical protein